MACAHLVPCSHVAGRPAGIMAGIADVCAIPLHPLRSPADQAFEDLLEATGAAEADDMAQGAPGINVQHSGKQGWATCGEGRRSLELGWDRTTCVCGCPLMPLRWLLVLPGAETGATALMAAAIHGRADIVSALLANGVSRVVPWHVSMSIMVAFVPLGPSKLLGPQSHTPVTLCVCPPCGAAPPQAQADPSISLHSAQEGQPDRTARDLAALYGHQAVLEVLDDFQEQVGGGWAPVE
jgi:hypothetical protein